jgi:dihydroorotate dehydrogenase (fumarate)
LNRHTRKVEMDLSADYMGLRLRSPLIASASPLTGDPRNLRKLEEYGAGAVVLPSVFEEQSVAERNGSRLAQYLDLVRRAKRTVVIPVIASLNCVTLEGWSNYARRLQESGADAIELNTYITASDPSVSGAEIERRYLEILAAVKAVVQIPVAMKVGPYFSSLGAMARALADGGANGLVLFNRYYQLDIDLESFGQSMDVELSAPSEIRLPLLWISILFQRVASSLAASSGVDTAADAFKCILAGADAVTTASALLRRGVAHMQTLRDGLIDSLAAHGFHSLLEARGQMSRRRSKLPLLYERAHYIEMVQGYRVPDPDGGSEPRP